MRQCVKVRMFVKLFANDSPSMGSYTLDKTTLECSVSESDLQDLKCFLPVKQLRI